MEETPGFDHPSDNQNNQLRPNEECSPDMILQEGEEGLPEWRQNMPSWPSPQRFMDYSDMFGHRHGHSEQGQGGWLLVILHLAFQSIGVVYGDIGTSPLYVYPSAFGKGVIKYKEDILGVLSLIVYTITIITLVKYVFIVLLANDNGNGGTFALYSLICRHAKVGMISSQVKDGEQFGAELPKDRPQQQAWRSRLKSALEGSYSAKLLLLLATMLGTSMVIGDGVLTPCISDKIVWISVAILVCLFTFQWLGTDKVGYCFAPIICVWFALIGGIGLYNIFKFDPRVIRAIVNPIYIVHYFKRNGKDGWISLGGIVLAVTGSEALFADVGHFTVRSIQISMCSVTYPSLILAYMGQASFLQHHPDLVSDVFFKSVPGPLYWSMFVLAVLAAVIASQAMISDTSSIIQQSLTLGCFPPVKIIHTSTKYKGQVYIPEINYLLMLACVCVTLGFRTTGRIGNAYGIAVVSVMILTSAFIMLIMILIWKTHMLLVISYLAIVGSVEILYLSSVLYKFYEGGYLPLGFAAALMVIMYVWNDVYRRKYQYELDHKVSPEEIKEIAADPNLCRIPGLAIFYSELVQGAPPIFRHYVENVPSLHSMIVFLSIKSLPIGKVPVEERFLFQRMEPYELNVFGCIVRYGYTDLRYEAEAFERTFVERLVEFAREDLYALEPFDDGGSGRRNRECSVIRASDQARTSGGALELQAHIRDKVDVLEKARLDRVVHLIGETEVVAEKGAGIWKRVLIEYAYNFLKKNVRQNYMILDIPHERMLKIGMTYEL
ncbi:hypothetical protein SAY86_015509 [Trapa natans]|uniref:Potassium transporter n=1 Tax=Trapa natans TaxID=22666 RepID=A0AAN7L7W2_TRANT|nr:hypothetical protein SAY86_015509 [Trapa natans]